MKYICILILKLNIKKGVHKRFVNTILFYLFFIYNLNLFFFLVSVAQYDVYENNIIVK